MQTQRPEPGYTTAPARYSKNAIAVRCESAGGWMTRAMRLCEALKGRYSHRENAYIVSPTKAQKLARLFADGYDASPIMGEIYKPADEDTD